MFFFFVSFAIPGRLTVLAASRFVCFCVPTLWCSMRTLRSKLLLGKKHETQEKHMNTYVFSFVSYVFLFVFVFHVFFLCFMFFCFCNASLARMKTPSIWPCSNLLLLTAAVTWFSYQTSIRNIILTYHVSIENNSKM